MSVFERPEIDHIIREHYTTTVYWKDGTSTPIMQDPQKEYDIYSTVCAAFVLRAYDGDNRPLVRAIREGVRIGEQMQAEAAALSEQSDEEKEEKEEKEEEIDFAYSVGYVVDQYGDWIPIRWDRAPDGMPCDEDETAAARDDSEAACARREGFRVDDDGNWIPLETGYSWLDDLPY